MPLFKAVTPQQKRLHWAGDARSFVEWLHEEGMLGDRAEVFSWSTDVHKWTYLWSVDLWEPHYTAPSSNSNSNSNSNEKEHKTVGFSVRVVKTINSNIDPEQIGRDLMRWAQMVQAGSYEFDSVDLDTLRSHVQDLEDLAGEIDVDL